MAKAASVEDLLKSGAHFGHLTRRWNPKMREFIFMQRNGIHIIDLNKTHACLQESLDELGKIARSGKNILFVGTKKQAQETIRKEAQRCDMPYVTHRWLGGMLTNFVTIKKSISRMEEIHAMQTDGTYDNIIKKERLMLDREKKKLEDVMGGISKMGRVPGALFVVDIVKENIAVNEALKLNIPIFALVDTNCDPDIPDYIIPCNDDAARAIQLIASNIADAIIEGMAEREAYQEEQLAAESMAKDDGKDKEEMTEADVKPTRRKRSRKAKTATAADSGKEKADTAKQETPSGEQDAAGTEEKTGSEKQDAAGTEEKAGSGKQDTAGSEEKAGSGKQDTAGSEEKAGSEKQDAAGTEEKAGSGKAKSADKPASKKAKSVTSDSQKPADAEPSTVKAEPSAEKAEASAQKTEAPAEESEKTTESKEKSGDKQEK